jgi:ABC-2 type transport system ATP-binding protein
VKTDDVKNAVTVIEKDMNVSDYKVIDGSEIRIYDDSVKADGLNKTLIKNDVSVSGIYETGISLEDYFKSLVGEV